MKTLVIITFSILVSGLSFAQEVRLGLIVGAAPVKHVSLGMEQHSPSNSYFTYVEEDQGEGLINEYKPFNSVHIGAVLNFSYKRFAFNIEPQYFFERSVYRFKVSYDRMSRVIGTKAFRMPTYFTYKFFKKETSAYLLLGLNFTNGKNWDIQHPSEEYYVNGLEAYPYLPDFGDDHFKDVLYDDQSSTLLTIGIGKQFKKFNSSLRFLTPIGRVNNRLPVRSYQAELTFSWLFLSTKDFTQKHPLYVD